MLLDLTAAFDTVDNGILISRLEQWVGIRGVDIDWFRSYLVDRTFSVSIGDFLSSSAPLSWGVPQGSVLRPLLSLLAPAWFHPKTWHFIPLLCIPLFTPCSVTVG